MRIFIGGPGDVWDETRRIFAICSEIKPTLEAITGDDVVVVDWTRLPPSQGNAQDQIFELSRFKDADIFVFVFWHRFGTPTGGIAKWRADLKQPDTHYLSGTEEEFELALQVAKTKADRQRRIMTYRCNRAIPQERLDPKQLANLNEYFKERVEPQAFYRKFETLQELELKFFSDVLNISHRVTKLERHAQRALLKLQEEYSGVSSEFPDPFPSAQPAMMRKYIANECRAAGSIISSMANPDSLSCRVRTTDLYDRILDILGESDAVCILDLDIRRWNELINNDDRLYTMNYSMEILEATVQRIEDHPNFHLQRIFVIRTDDVNNTRMRSRILSILQRVDRFIKSEGVASGMHIKVLIDSYALMREGRRLRVKQSVFKNALKLINKTKDIVLCDANGGSILLREEISLDDPKSAFDTWGHISCNKKELESARKTFDKAWDLALMLDDAMKLLSGIDKQSTKRGRVARARRVGRK